MAFPNVFVCYHENFVDLQITLGRLVTKVRKCDLKVIVYCSLLLFYTLSSFQITCSFSLKRAGGKIKIPKHRDIIQKQEGAQTSFLGRCKSTVKNPRLRLFCKCVTSSRGYSWRLLTFSASQPLFSSLFLALPAMDRCQTIS